MHPTPSLPNLPQSVALEALHSLRTGLPPLLTDTPDADAARNASAMAAVAALHPSDAFEARLAAQIVAADAQATECFRLAGLPDQDLAIAMRCRSQAAAMMRLMQSGLRALQRTQATREKAEAAMHPAAMEAAGWWFRDASVPLPVEAPEPPAEPAPAEDPFAAMTEAEQYAVIYPERAARIRAHGGLPPWPGFGPPEPDLIAALVNGTSPTLLALDRVPQREPAITA